jgi:predicted membrane chloride channel (bestrophin family)
MTSFRRFFGTITANSILIIVLSVAATLVCVWQGWSGDLPQPLVATAVIFPIAFSINAAYSRRAEALACQSSIASNIVMVFFAHRDWPAAGGETHARRSRELILRLLETIRESMSARDGVDAGTAKAYGIFSDLSASIELLRRAGVSSTEIANINQYMRSTMQDVERMRRILLYPTPSSLRDYTKFFLYGLPVLLGPYFAFLATKHGNGLGCFVAVMYSFILVSLDHVQEQLENPFDGVGADDVNLDMAGFYAQVLVPSLGRAA